MNVCQLQWSSHVVLGGWPEDARRMAVASFCRVIMMMECFSPNVYTSHVNE